MINIRATEPIMLIYMSRKGILPFIFWRIFFKGDEFMINSISNLVWGTSRKDKSDEGPKSDLTALSENLKKHLKEFYSKPIVDILDEDMDILDQCRSLNEKYPDAPNLSQIATTHYLKLQIALSIGYLLQNHDDDLNKVRLFVHLAEYDDRDSDLWPFMLSEDRYSMHWPSWKNMGDIVSELNNDETLLKTDRSALYSLKKYAEYLSKSNTKSNCKDTFHEWIDTSLEYKDANKKYSEKLYENKKVWDVFGEPTSSEKKILNQPMIDFRSALDKLADEFNQKIGEIEGRFCV